jgi:hypothetical protein
MDTSSAHSLRNAPVALGAALGLALTLLALDARAAAIEVDADECREAAQFIGNAALSRQNGMSRESFVGRLDDDLMLLSSMPPERRWFVHGDAEASYLRAAVLDVFDAPRAPREHAQGFLVNCLQSAGLDANVARVPPLHDRRAGAAAPL